MRVRAHRSVLLKMTAAIVLSGCGAPAANAPPGSTGDDMATGGGGAGGGGGGGTLDGGVADLAPGDLAQPPPASDIKVVAYLPNYRGSYADWAKQIEFHKMTHLNLAFATATDQNDWDLGADDAAVDALVAAAHAAGTRVLASLGGGGGDQSVIARYQDPKNIDPLVANLAKMVMERGFDGVDVDIEDENQLGANYATFVDKTIAALHPKGKLVTAAVAQYLQGGMSDDTLHKFDFVNVMIYTSYDDSVAQLAFYSGQKHVPKTKLTLGAPFFGTDSSGKEYGYDTIMDADGSAWSKDTATVNGKSVHYCGVATMKKLAEYSKGFGGIMFWELSQDVTGEHSLYKAIESTM